MNKKSILWILLDLVFVIVFNTVFFTLGGLNHSSSAWLSYVFIHISYIMVLVTASLIKKSSSSAVFGFSLYTISSAYFLAEFLVGTIFIFLNQDQIVNSLVVQVIIAGIYSIILISHLLANEKTAESIEKHEAETIYIKSVALQVQSIMRKTDNKTIAKELDKVYDLLYSSPVKTIPAVNYMEWEIQNHISELESLVATKDEESIVKICSELIQTIDERNRQIKLSQ